MDPVPAETLMQPPYDGNVANLLARPVEMFPDRVAIEHAGEEVTYAEFHDRVRRIAGGLREMGLEPGDRLCVYLPNGIGFCETIWACIHAGVVASPINPEYRRREITYQFENSDSMVVICDGEREEWAEPVAEEVGLEVVSTDPESEHTTLDDLAARGEPTLVERDDENTLLQPYTSGTTGEPKGVLLTHRNFRVQIVNGVSSYTAGQIRGDAMVILPMYHITGVVGMTTALSTGRTLHLLRPDQWDPDLVLRKLDEYDVPAFTGVATMFMDLLQTYQETPDAYDLSTLRQAGQGGDKLPIPVHEEFEEVFGVSVSEGYGLTETTAATHAVRYSSLGDKIGSVGQPAPHTHSMVVDPETGEEVPDGEEGEIVVKGPQVMKGYYERPDANEEAFTEDGYFRTGDRGHRDRDNYYYVSGREKDMILTGGYNVYPSEVEKVLYDHPEIHEVAVFGIPDERKGETVAAAVTLVEGSTLTEAEIQEYVLEELAPYKHPRVVEIRDQLPKTGSGKIRKVELRDEFGTHEREGE
ncbi:MAG: class I adenylate-forming enzyme family protein [Haloarculaceae archaeon]